MPTTYNQSADHAENYKGHVEILDGATWYKFDSILDISVLTRVDTEKHYSTNGAKKKTTTGDSSTYEFKVKQSADLYSTLTTPTEVRTISYFKNQIYTLPRTLPIISMRVVSQSNAASNSFIVDQFTATIENIDELRVEGKGVQEVVISGEILTHTSDKRQAAAP